MARLPRATNGSAIRPPVARWILIAAFAILLASPDVGAQEPDTPPAGRDSLPAGRDSLPAGRDSLPVGRDSLPVGRDSLPAGQDRLGAPGGGAESAQKSQRPVSPTGAMLRSIIVPGWGQTAARQPARGAIYFTVWTGGVYMILKTNSEVNAAERGEDQDLIDSRKQTRENWILFTGLWALVSGVDAWVSAQFAGFEGAVRPPEDGSPGVEFSIPVRLF